MQEVLTSSIVLFGLMLSPLHATSQPSKNAMQIKEIQFIGNQNISSDRLKSQLLIREGEPIDSISVNGTYDRKRFDREMQILNLAYFNEGFVQVKIDRPQIKVNPDKKEVSITFKVREGSQFKVGKVDFKGNWPAPRADLLELTHIQKQDFFNYQVLQDDLKAIESKFGEAGTPIPRTRIRAAAHEVDITFEIAKK